MNKSKLFTILCICACGMVLLGIGISFLPGNSFFPGIISRVSSVLCLGVLLFFFLENRKLLTRTEGIRAELAESKKNLEESSSSMQAVFDCLDNGICTVDRDLIIEGSYNKEFSTLFGFNEWKGQPLLSTAFAAWSPEKKEELKQTLDLAFNSTTSSDEMINDVLPSRELIAVGSIPGDARYIQFSIVRIIRRDSVERIMFVFSDVTLSRRMKEEEEQHRKVMADQYDRIHQMLQHERAVVFSFFRSLTVGMERIAEEFKKLEKGTTNPEIVRNTIAIVHGIKGEAFSLEFESCAQKAKDMEMYLRKVENTEFSMEVHLKLIGLYETLLNEKRIYDRMLGKMAALVGQEGKANKKNGEREETLDIKSLESSLQIICKKSCEASGKKAVLQIKPDSVVPGQKTMEAFKDVLIHLIRNSLSHGIESPEEREKAGKKPEGNLTIEITKEGNDFSLIYQDDGRGFDYPSIREKIVDLGIKKADEVKNLSNGQLVKYLFEDGFSTAKEADMMAGIGSGLYAVKKILSRDLHGKIKIKSLPGRGIRIHAVLPGE